MIKYSILLLWVAWLWLMLVQLLNLIPKKLLLFCQHAPEWISEVQLQSRKRYVALLAVDTCIKSQRRPVCSCSRCAPGAGDGIDCALSGKKWNEPQSTRNQRLTFKKVFFFYSHPSLQEFEINHPLLRPHFLKEVIYLADHCPEKNSDEYKESILLLYLFRDRIIPSTNLVYICWITYLFVSAPNLQHSPVCFQWEQLRLVKKWYPSMSVWSAD